MTETSAVPRRKSYDREEAVVKACNAFWAHGYQALGVRELEQLTGLNQFAIRSEFGGKEGLYLEALAFYHAAAVATPMAPLRAGGVSAVIDFLEGLITDGSPTSSAWGCLIVNTGVENARLKSDQLDAATRLYWAALAEHFECALSNGQSNGEVQSGVDIKATARALVAGVMGVHVQNRTLQVHDAGRPLVALLCAYLQSIAVS